MYVSGHLAMGYLVAAGPAVGLRRPLDIRNALLPALLGSVTPDIIDKPLRALELIQYSRGLGHSLFFLALIYVVWKILAHRGARIARPFGYWTAGIAAHHFADLTNDLFRGLEARGFIITAWPFWPITDARTLAVQYDLGRHIRIHETYTSLEIGVYALTAAVIFASWYQQRHR